MSISSNHRSSSYYDMGCRLTRTESTELCEHSAKKEECSTASNGQSVLLQRDTNIQSYDHFRNGYPPISKLPSKPIGEAISTSQADFFRMLDAKIAHGADLDSENEA